MQLFEQQDLKQTNTQQKDLFAVVVITHNRLSLLKFFVESLLNSLARSDQSFSVYFAINGPDEESESYLKTFTQFNLKKINNKVSPAQARNLLVSDIQAEWLIFLDDDIKVPSDFFLNFHKLQQESNHISLFGGPNLTPSESTDIELKNGWWLQQSLITGPISKRYKINNLKNHNCSGLYFSLCNMCIKTEDFKKLMFKPYLKTAEENELIYKLAKNNIKMQFSDLLYVWHYRRNSLQAFLKQIKNYGYGRGQLICKGAVTSKDLLLIFFSFLLLCGAIFFYTPYFIIAISVLLMTIQMQFFYRFGISFKNLKFIFMPAKIWLNYFVGVAQGIIFSIIKNKKTNLQSQDIH